MDSDHDFDCIAAWHTGAYCYASLARRLHVMSVEDEVHEEVTQKSWMHEKLFAIKKLHSTLSRSTIMSLRLIFEMMMMCIFNGGSGSF